MLQSECEMNEETFDTEDLWLAQILIARAGGILLSL